jgi:hypothetical protein
VPLLVLETMLTPMIIAQTISLVRAGVDFTTGEILGPILGFVALAVMAVWMMSRVMRHIGESAVSDERVRTVPGNTMPVPQ